jgi:hypothetical protein
MDPLELFIINFYLPVIKAGNTKAEDLKRYAKRCPVPCLGSAKNGMPTVALATAINAHLKAYPYRLDPMNGIYDFYNHPEFSVWRQKYMSFDSPMDCDDFAVLAYALFKAAGVYTDNLRLWNLIVSAPAQFCQAWANHVICGFGLIDGKNDPWTGVIDTNTAARGTVFFFRGTPESSQAQTAIIAKFKAIYNADYYKIIPDKYPF